MFSILLPNNIASHVATGILEMWQLRNWLFKPNLIIVNLHLNSPMYLEATGGQGPPLTQFGTRLPLSSSCVCSCPPKMHQSSLVLPHSHFPISTYTPNPKSLDQHWPLNPRLLFSAAYRQTCFPDVSQGLQTQHILCPTTFLTPKPSFPVFPIFSPTTGLGAPVYHCMSSHCPKCLSSVSLSWGKAAIHRLKSLGLTARIHGSEHWPSCLLCDAKFSGLRPHDLWNSCESCNRATSPTVLNMSRTSYYICIFKRETLSRSSRWRSFSRSASPRQCSSFIRGKGTHQRVTKHHYQ